MNLDRVHNRHIIVLSQNNVTLLKEGDERNKIKNDIPKSRLKGRFFVALN